MVGRLAVSTFQEQGTLKKEADCPACTQALRRAFVGWVILWPFLMTGCVRCGSRPQ